MSEDKKTIREFTSYNGLDRTVLWGGVPLLFMVLLLFLATMLFLIGLAFFGIAGFLFPILLFPLYFWGKTVCENDDKAFEIILIEMRYLSKRVGYKEFGNTHTFINDSSLRPKKNFENFFKDYK